MTAEQRPQVANPTPGPWEAHLNPHSERWEIRYGGSLGGGGIYPVRHAPIEMPDPEYPEEHIAEIAANARLIAAAPDLLRAAEVALAKIKTHTSVYHHGPYEAADVLADAIRKARGES